MTPEKFSAEVFTPEPKNYLVAATWYRDVDHELVGFGDGDCIRWAVEIPDEPTEQILRGIRLKWFMDVDEMFYAGDEALGVKGLLNGGFEEENGKSILMEPLAFGKASLSGALRLERPCKWLQPLRLERFTYDRSKLLFKLNWPILANVGGKACFVGGIAPLVFKKG